MPEQVEELQPLLEEDLLDLDDADDVVLQPKKRRFPLWAIIVIVILVLALIAVTLSHFLIRRTSAIQYTQAAVQSGNLSVQVSTSGPLTPNAEYAMNFPAAGQITEVDVKVGDHVTTGQTLAKIKVTQTSNNFANGGPTTTTTIDTLTAPADATVAAVNGNVGENVSANGTVTSGSTSSSIGAGSGSSSSAFMTLVDVSKYMISASVNETDINSIKVGQAAQFTVSAYPSTTLRATVTSIDILGQTSSSVVTYAVQLAVDMTSVNNVNLFPGMTATVDITTAQRLNTLIIPTTATTFPTTALQNGEINRADYIAALRSAAGNASTSGSTATGNSRVVMELKNGKLTPVLIKIGLSSTNSVEVLSGLQAGDQVVTGQIGGTTTTSATTGAGGLGGGLGGIRLRGGAGGAGGFGGGAGAGRGGAGAGRGGAGAGAAGGN
ncbi:HlyD family efflux transporter periplasmic adaptor subunit [Ktedonobacteria bacterium brp13]|nr:HlyD family efflux transporter periplasmic adaptor subunit [Ktedonobacteria bacterium brp13]